MCAHLQCVCAFSVRMSLLYVFVGMFMYTCLRLHVCNVYVLCVCVRILRDSKSQCPIHSQENKLSHLGPNVGNRKKQIPTQSQCWADQVPNPVSMMEFEGSRSRSHKRYQRNKIPVPVPLTCKVKEQFSQGHGKNIIKLCLPWTMFSSIITPSKF